LGEPNANIEQGTSNIEVNAEMQFKNTGSLMGAARLISKCDLDFLNP
jgi:hypothetical protein